MDGTLQLHTSAGDRCYEDLSPFEQWMVRSNLETVRSTGVTVDRHVALLEANGYPRIARAVAAEVEAANASLCDAGPSASDG